METAGEHLKCFKSFAASAEHRRWRLSRLENGLRIFEEDESREVDSSSPHPTSISTPASKGVGLIFSHPEFVFNLLMDLGKSRSHWDLTFDHGEVVERLADNSDIIRVTFRKQFSSLSFRLRRSWCCDADGSFTIALTSVKEPKCANQRDLATGDLFGGWMIAPYNSASTVNAGIDGALKPEWTSACLVTNATKVQRGGWFEWLRISGGGVPLALRVVSAQVAGLREFSEHTSDMMAVQGQHVASMTRITSSAEDDDDFFEASSEASDEDLSCNASSRGDVGYTEFAFGDQRKTPGVVRAGEGVACEIERGDGHLGSLDEGRWPFEAGCKSANCWCAPEGDYFRVRGINYLRDRKKTPAGIPYADLVAVDWFVDDQRIDNVCARPTGTCQRKILSDSHARERFVFAVNIQVPGSRHHSIVYYYVLNEPLVKESLFGRFVLGDDEFRNARLKLIPNVALGPWVVQRAVGTKPLIVGRALKVMYHSTPNFLEVDIDIGSSTVANNVVRFVLGYVRTLVVDMCFLIEGKTDEELPERLIGTSRVAHLEPDSAVAPPPLE